MQAEAGGSASEANDDERDNEPDLEPDPEPPAGAAARTRDLHLYLTGNIGLTFANGIQLVLYAWLVANVLGESAERVGLAQAAMMVPALAFTLVGGLVADRFDALRLLPALHAAALPE